MKTVRFNSRMNEMIPPEIIQTHFKVTHKRIASMTTRPNNIRKLNNNSGNETPRKSNLKTSKAQIEQKLKAVIKIRDQIMKQYNSLLELYETNEQKLRRIILSELDSNNNYLYTKQLMAFIKFPDPILVKKLNFQLFKHDLLTVLEFLTYFNAKKRMKQVDIIKESILSREMMIRQESSNQEYQQIYKNMRIPLKNMGFNIYDQYKNIKSDFNLPNIENNIHQILYNKMCNVEECVSEVMRAQSQIKQRQRFHIIKR